jgi:hypothetical protein
MVKLRVKAIFPDIYSLLPVHNFPDMIYPTAKSTLALFVRLGQILALAVFTSVEIASVPH